MIETSFTYNDYEYVIYKVNIEPKDKDNEHNDLLTLEWDYDDEGFYEKTIQTKGNYIFFPKSGMTGTVAYCTITSSDNPNYCEQIKFYYDDESKEDDFYFFDARTDGADGNGNFTVIVTMKDASEDYEYNLDSWYRDHDLIKFVSSSMTKTYSYDDGEVTYTYTTSINYKGTDDFLGKDIYYSTINEKHEIFTDSIKTKYNKSSSASTLEIYNATNVEKILITCEESGYYSECKPNSDGTKTITGLTVGNTYSVTFSNDSIRGNAQLFAIIDSVEYGSDNLNEVVSGGILSTKKILYVSEETSRPHKPTSTLNAKDYLWAKVSTSKYDAKTVDVKIQRGDNNYVDGLLTMSENEDSIKYGSDALNAAKFTYSEQYFTVEKIDDTYVSLTITENTSTTTLRTDEFIKLEYISSNFSENGCSEIKLVQDKTVEKEVTDNGIGGKFWASANLGGSGLYSKKGIYYYFGSTDSDSFGSFTSTQIEKECGSASSDGFYDISSIVIEGTNRYDAVTKANSAYKIPSKDDWVHLFNNSNKELIDNGSSIKFTDKNYGAQEITKENLNDGTNNSSIAIPACGYYDDMQTPSIVDGNKWYYMTSSISSQNNSNIASGKVMIVTFEINELGVFNYDFKPLSKQEWQDRKFQIRALKI